MDYKRLYTMLFNEITDAIEHIECGDTDVAKEILIKAQQDAEDIYIEEEE